jgi:hypothetical protein
MEISVPLYILGSIANFFVWGCVYKSCLKFKEKKYEQYTRVATYDPDDDIPLTIHETI